MQVDIYGLKVTAKVTGYDMQTASHEVTWTSLKGGACHKMVDFCRDKVIRECTGQGP
jgi:hypothetical protein